MMMNYELQEYLLQYAEDYALYLEEKWNREDSGNFYGADVLYDEWHDRDEEVLGDVEGYGIPTQQAVELIERAKDDGRLIAEGRY